MSRYGIVDEYYENPAFTCELCGMVPRFCRCYEPDEPKQPQPEQPGPPGPEDELPAYLTAWPPAEDPQRWTSADVRVLLFGIGSIVTFLGLLAAFTYKVVTG